MCSLYKLYCAELTCLSKSLPSCGLVVCCMHVFDVHVSLGTDNLLQQTGISWHAHIVMCLSAYICTGNIHEPTADLLDL